MSFKRTRSELEDAITIFKTVFRLFKKPIHYRKLSDHLAFHRIGEKTFFRSLKDSEKFLFFGQFFKIDSTGYVTCTESEMLEEFVKQLKFASPQHFLMLIQDVQIANTYFRQSSEYEKLSFFKHHPQFVVQDNDYVELRNLDTEPKSFFDNDKASLLVFLKDYLKSSGPVYYYWLLDYMENSKYYSGLIANEPHVEDLLWNFLQSHDSDFIISDCGFVDLSSHFKSEVEVDTNILDMENEVVGFFIAKLELFGCLNYVILLKFLQDSKLGIRCFFAKCSLEQIHKFFAKHSSVFVLRGKIVYMLRDVPADGLITFDGYEYPFEDMKEILFFFLDCLKMESPSHCRNLSKMLIKSYIQTDFKYALLGFPSKIKIFLQIYRNIFCVENNGCVSLHSLQELCPMGQCAIKHFKEKLKDSSGENFWTLISSAEASSEQFREYFASFSPLDKFYFFKKFPSVFSTNPDGYVSNEIDPIMLFREEEVVIDVLIEQLKIIPRVHFQKLCLLAGKSSHVSKAFFQSCSISQKFTFFSGRPDYFFIDSDDYVSIPSSSHTFNSELKETRCESVSKSGNFQIDTNCESSKLMSDAESSKQNGYLNEYSTPDSNIKCKHVKNSINSAISEGMFYMEKQYANAKGFLNKRESETSNDNDCVSSTKSSIYKNLSHDLLSEETHKTGQVIKFLTNVVKLHKRVHFEELCLYNKQYATEFANYFSSYSVDEKYNFFKNNVKYFSMDNDGYLSIPDNSQNCNSVLSTSNLKLNEHTIGSVSPSIEQCATNHAENSVFKLKSTNGSIAEEPVRPQCAYHISKDTNNTNEDLNKKLLSSQNHLSGLHKLNNDKKSYAEVDVIRILKSHLYVHKSMHCLKLCKVADYYFQSYSDSEKFGFFKHLPGHFCIDKDNYVTLSCDTAENSLKASKNESKVMADVVVKLLVNVLKTKGKIDYRQLCDSNNDTINFFKSFTTKEKFEFFTSWPKEFSISWRGDVSLSEDVAESKISVSPLKSISTSPPIEQCAVSHGQNCFFEKKKVSGRITEEPPTLQCKKHISKDTGYINGALNKKPLLSQNHLSGLHKLNSDKGSYAEVDIIGILKSHLYVHKSMHCLKLCKVADYYFQSYSDSEKFGFFKRHPRHFYIGIDNYVTLSRDTAESSLIVSKNDSKVMADVVVKMLVNVLKTKGKIDYRQLCDSNNDTITFFKSFTTKEKFEFFTSWPKEFSISWRGDVSLSEDVAESKISVSPIKSISTSPPIEQCAANHGQNCFLEKKKVSDSITDEPPTLRCEKRISKDTIYANDALNKKPLLSQNHLSGLHKLNSDKESYSEVAVIGILKSHLYVHKSVHCLKLCKVADYYFQSYSDSEKFGFFKRLPGHFCIGRDNYVTLSCDTAENSLIASKNESKIMADVVVKMLVNVLKTKGKIDYRQLCNSNNDTITFFKSFTTKEKFEFFTSWPKEFSISWSGDVSLSEVVADSKIFVSPIKSISTSPPIEQCAASHGQNCFFEKKKVSDSITEEPPTLRCKKHISKDTSYVNDALSKKPLLSQNLLSDLRKLDNDEFYEDGVIQILKSHLNVRKCMHYLKLCKAADYYFWSYSDLQKFEFFKRLPEHFCIDGSNYVTLSYDTTENESKVMADVIVKMLVDILKTKRKVDYEVLCNSNNDTMTFFKSFTTSEKFKFFTSRPKEFSISWSGDVSLSEDVMNSKISVFPIKPISSSPSIEQCATNHVENSVFEVKTSSGWIPEKPVTLQCKERISRETSDVNDSLNKKPLLSQNPLPDLHKSSSGKESNKDVVIRILKSHLNLYKRVHCFKLCKAADYYFRSYSDSQKFQFFKRLPKHFSIGGDNYVTLPRDTAEISSIDLKNKAKAKDDLVKILVDVLRKERKVHYEILCNSNNITSTYFKFFTTNQRFEFFETRPKYFSISWRGNVVLSEDVMDSEIPIFPIKSISTSASIEQCATSHEPKSVFKKTNATDLVIEKPLTLPCKSHISEGTIYTNDTNEKLLLSQNRLSGLHKLSNAKESSEDVIRILKSHLFIHKRLHCLKLCKVAEFYFQSYSDSEKFGFFKHLPEHFRVGVDNYVTLSCNSAQNSSVAVKNQSKVRTFSLVKVLVNVLKKEKKVHYENLCNSSEEVASHFKSFTKDEKFGFFKNHPKDFSISHRGDVSLPESVANSKVSVSLCKSQTSSNSRSLNTTKEELTSESVFPETVLKIRQESLKLGNRECSVINANPAVKTICQIPFAYECTSNRASNTECNSSDPNCRTSSNTFHPFKGNFLQHQESDFIIPPPVPKSVSAGNPNTHSLHQVIESGNYSGSSQDVMKEKSTLICESKHAGSDILITSHRLNTNVASNSMSLRKVSNPETSIKVVADNTVKLVRTHDSYETGRNISINGIEMGINDVAKQIYACGANYNATQKLQGKETESILQADVSEITFQFVPQIVSTMLEQLKKVERMHFLTLCESCEKHNRIVQNFFFNFSNDDKLDFFRTYPRYFVVDNDFISASNTTRYSSSTAAHNVIERHEASPNNAKSSNYSHLLNSTVPPLNSSSANEVLLQNLNDKELLNFFCRILRSTYVLHFEELFSMLKASSRFTNYMTTAKKADQLKFFEDHPHIFDTRSRGYITLVNPAKKVEMPYNTNALDYEDLHLSPYHILCIRYCIKILQENERVHYKQLTKHVCVEHSGISSFFKLFRTSSELLDFFKMHSMYFTVNSLEEVTVKNSGIISDIALSAEDEVRDIKFSIILKAIEFLIAVLKTKGTLSVDKLKNELQYAPGYVNSFITFNYPCSEVHFFIRHPNYFALDGNGQLTLTANKMKELVE